jgi:uncharacterized 2Fe-2S/4Fe-4S cluster protein (DUF4445 family)
MKITFQPEKKTVAILPEQTLLEAAHSVGVNIVATCGGRGRCNSCRIQVIEGNFTPPTDQEVKILGEKGLQHGFRLSCQTRALGDGIVRVVPPISERAFQILSQTERQAYAIAPDICKHHLLLPKTSEEQQSSDFEDIQKLGEVGLQQIDLPTLQALPSTIFQASRNVTVVSWDHQVIAVEPGDTTQHLYGIAFDIGTTTVVGYLLDLRTGQELAVSSALNDQTRYGGDIMSRITFAQQNQTGLQKLHISVIQTVNSIIDDVCDQANIDHQQIYEMSVVGNTCMHHLFLNISPIHLGLAPYLAAIRKRYVVPVSDLGINICPQGRVVMLPLIAGFVGADTVGVVLATGMHRSNDIKLAVDIGTNGEIVLGTKDRLIACSTAAGAAFEGAQITHGMRGASGAIDKVVIDDDVHIHVIGDSPALGICGSGLVDAIAQMLNAGIINSSGRLLNRAELEKHGSISPLLKERIIEEYRKRQFILAYGNQTESGEPIVITQQDIRELQLAKGAIFAGINMLIKKLEIQAEDIVEILLAGAFGNYLDKHSAVRIGLLPAFPPEKIRSVGNAAGLGSQLALLSGQAKQEADQIAKFTAHIALTNNPVFQHAFAEAMAFPA